MDSFSQKRQEWSSQAKFIENNCFQNGRNIPELIFDQIINDIKSKLILDQKNKSLIDVGCGNGIILSRMSGYFEKLFGVCVTKIISARFIPDLNSLKPPTGKT